MPANSWLMYGPIGMSNRAIKRMHLIDNLIVVDLSRPSTAREEGWPDLARVCSPLSLIHSVYLALISISVAQVSRAKQLRNCRKHSIVSGATEYR